MKQAEFSLGEMTILCGRNNTGKTYATYALFGFLSYWREIFSVSINGSKINELLSEGVTHIDISEYAKRAEDILLDGCNAYVKQLPVIFAAPAVRFKNTDFQVSLDLDKISLVSPYSRRISSANSELFSISKNESTDLVVTLLGDKGKTKIPKNIIIQVISNALKDIIFGQFFSAPFIASAERTGAAIFRKELNFARNRLLEEMSQSDNKVDPMSLLLKVYQDYANKLSSMLLKQSDLENKQDLRVMSGEAQRDMNDRKDKDNFYTQLGIDEQSIATGIQKFGKNLNKGLERKLNAQALSMLSKWFNSQITANGLKTTGKKID